MVKLSKKKYEKLKKEALDFMEKYNLVVGYMRYFMYKKFPENEKLGIFAKYFMPHFNMYQLELAYADEDINYLNYLKEEVNDLKNRDKKGIVEFKFRIGNKRKEMCKELESLFNIKLKNLHTNYNKKDYIFIMNTNVFDQIYTAASMMNLELWYTY